MTAALLAAAVAPVAYGSATVVQAAAAQRMTGARGDLGRMLRAGSAYAIGLILDLGGFVATLAALRSVPLFVVQALVASSVCVTALVLRARGQAELSRLRWFLLAANAAGLAALALSASDGTADHRHATALGVVLAVATLVPAVAVVLALRSRRPARRSLAAAFAAGVGFAIVAVAARDLPARIDWHLAASPTPWVILANGALATAAYGIALAHASSVTAVAATTFTTETVLPAAIGLLVLGDHTRHGFAAVAAAGLVVTVVACVLLAKAGEPAHPDPVEAPARPRGEPVAV